MNNLQETIEKVKKFVQQAHENKVSNIEVLRTLAKGFGLASNPVGGGNKKTHLPGNYRPVGASCPSSCPYLPDEKGKSQCYALRAHVNIAQKRSSTDLEKSLTSAAIVMISAANTGTHARLHVSGDFFIGDKLDIGYLDGLTAIGKLIHRLTGVLKVRAYSYTHAKSVADLRRIAKLKEVGIVVLQSDSIVKGGAIIADWDKLPELRKKHKGLHIAKCPAQMPPVRTRQGTERKASCATCDLCVTAEERGICIAFKPDYMTKAQSPQLVQIGGR